MKIKKIEVKNLKAISDEVAEFNGCSAIITAGNRQGKSTMLKSLIDRFRGEIPKKIVKEGEDKGFYFMLLDDNSKIEWKFTEKSESFSYTTPDGVKMTQGVLKSIGEKYFGIKFDIDKFINEPPKGQMKLMSKLVGVDLEEIDAKYKQAYDLRTEANKEMKRISADKKTEPIPVDKPDVEKLKKSLKKIKDDNEKTKNGWKLKNEDHLQSISVFNKKQDELAQAKLNALSLFNKLRDFEYSFLAEFIDFNKAELLVKSLKDAEPLKPIISLPDPTLTDETFLESQIEEAQTQLRAYDSYASELKAYEEWVHQGKLARINVDECDSSVKNIEAEKAEMIKNSNIPDGFDFSEEGLLYNGFLLDDNAISSSEKYIAGLKLGLMSLGKIETMHFDASFLDRNSLNEVQAFAEANGIQLLIERPDFEGSDEIKYEIL